MILYHDLSYTFFIAKNCAYIFSTLHFQDIPASLQRSNIDCFTETNNA